MLIIYSKAIASGDNAFNLQSVVETYINFAHISIQNWPEHCGQVSILVSLQDGIVVLRKAFAACTVSPESPQNSPWSSTDVGLIDLSYTDLTCPQRVECYIECGCQRNVVVTILNPVIHADRMWLPLWLEKKKKNGHKCKNLTKNGEPQRYSWKCGRRRRIQLPIPFCYCCWLPHGVYCGKVCQAVKFIHTSCPCTMYFSWVGAVRYVYRNR